MLSLALVHLIIIMGLDRYIIVKKKEIKASLRKSGLKEECDSREVKEILHTATFGTR